MCKSSLLARRYWGAGGWVWGNRHQRYRVIGGWGLGVDVRQNQKPGDTFEPLVPSRR